MSRYQTFSIQSGLLPNDSTRIWDVAALQRALADLGFQEVEIHSKPQRLYGYKGDLRAESAEVIVRRQFISSASNDIGFRQQPDGSYKAIISKFDRARFSAKWLDKLLNQYLKYANNSGLPLALSTGAIAARTQREKKQQHAADQIKQQVNEQLKSIKQKTASTVTASVKTPFNISQQHSQGKSSKKALSMDLEASSKKILLRLPKIREEYAALIEKGWLSAQEVSQVLEQVKLSLKKREVQAARAHLQALDQARIQAVRSYCPEVLAEISYAETRLLALQSKLPSSCVQSLQSRIKATKEQWETNGTHHIANFHEQLTELEIQAIRIQDAAQALSDSWTQAGYTARLSGYDDGDAIVLIETHEGAYTIMRVQFNGEQINLEGPPEDRPSCAARPQSVLALFQEQGYDLAWQSLDGQPVTEALLQEYVADPVDSPVCTVEASTVMPTSSANRKKRNTGQLS